MATEAALESLESLVIDAYKVLEGSYPKSTVVYFDNLKEEVSVIEGA